MNTAASPPIDELELSDVSVSVRARVADYYELIKPRMNALVVVTTAGGYYMATRDGGADWARLAHTIIGTAFTAVGASVLNQYVEREPDAKMLRTMNRPLPA